MNKILCEICEGKTCLRCGGDGFHILDNVLEAGK